MHQLEEPEFDWERMLMNLSDIILIITENRDPIFELSNLIWKAAVPTKVQGFCWWAVHEGKCL